MKFHSRVLGLTRSTPPRARRQGHASERHAVRFGGHYPPVPTGHRYPYRAQAGAGIFLELPNLMDALMKAVAQGRSKRVESQGSGLGTRWSGMEIAAISKLKPIQQPVLLPDFPQQVETDLEIMQVEVGGGVVQLSWSELDMATMPQPTPAFRQVKVVE